MIDPSVNVPQDPPPKSSLPLVALILACLFFVPLVPLVGAILGFVALGRIKRTPGMSGRGLAIASIPTGFVVFFVVQIALLGSMAAGFFAYRGRAEAVRTMEYQRQRVEKYRSEEMRVRQEQMELERKISELTKQLVEAKDENSRQAVREAIRRMRETSSRMARERAAQRRRRINSRGDDPLGGL